MKFHPRNRRIALDFPIGLSHFNCQIFKDQRTDEIIALFFLFTALLAIVAIKKKSELNIDVGYVLFLFLFQGRQLGSVGQFYEV